MKKSILLIFLFAFKYSLFSQMFVGIGEVIKNSSNYSDKQIYIRGDVVEIEKISPSECKYTIQDSEGNKILVNSVSGCPGVNKSYTVKGIVVLDQISFLVYFKEEKRKLLTAQTPSQDIEVIGSETTEDDIELDIIESDDTNNTEVEFIPPGEEVEEDVFIIVEKMPRFQGGDLNKFRIWITQNLNYPYSAAKKGIQGKVYVQFVVNSKGFVKDVKIIRSVDPFLDAEALRVVNASPRWEPGMQRGKPVDVQFTFPIVFALQ